MSRYEQVAKNTYDVMNSLEPVHIVAGALLKDTATLSYLVQLKLQNDSEYDVQKVTVVVVPFDANNKKGNEITHTYDDLDVSTNEAFGAKEPIEFATVKGMSSYQATVKDVVFKNGIKWSSGQKIEDAKSERNSEIQKRIENLIDEGSYKEAISLIDDLIDTEDNKKIIRNDCLVRFTEIANSKVSEGNIPAAEKVLEVIPTGYKGRKQIIDRLNEAKKKAYDDNQARKKKKKKISVLVAALIIVAISAGLVTTKVIIPNNHYNEAVKLYDAGSYEDALLAFQNLDGYKDSDQQIKKCKEAIQEEENKKIYNEALSCYKNGNIAKALSLLTQIQGYKDASDLYDKYSAELKGKAVAMLGEKMANDVYSLEVGDTFEFGKYMQERDSEEKQPIKWIVLDKGNGGYNALLISEEVLSYKQFNESKKTGTTWETSTLRKWLNSDFLETAFSKKEQKMIAISDVPSEGNEQYPDMEAGNSTKDQLFVPSVQELKSYCRYKEDEGYDDWFNPISQTTYAWAELVDFNFNTELVDSYSDAECSAWLRNPGGFENAIVFYQNSGGNYDSNAAFVDERGASANDDVRGVQPVLRIGPTE